LNGGLQVNSPLTPLTAMVVQNVIRIGGVVVSKTNRFALFVSEMTAKSQDEGMSWNEGGKLPPVV